MKIIFKYLWILIIILCDLGIFIYIFKELPFAIKHKEVKEFLEGSAGDYILFHILITFVTSFIYWCVTYE